MAPRRHRVNELRLMLHREGRPARDLDGRAPAAGATRGGAAGDQRARARLMPSTRGSTHPAGPPCERAEGGAAAIGVGGKYSVALALRHGDGCLASCGVAARIGGLVDDGVDPAGAGATPFRAKLKLRSSVLKAALRMSTGVFPSPRPLSASLLVMETSRTVGFVSHASRTVIEAVIVASLWLGGKRTDGESATVSSGGVVSAMRTTCVSEPTLL